MYDLKINSDSSFYDFIYYFKNNKNTVNLSSFDSIEFPENFYLRGDLVYNNRKGKLFKNIPKSMTILGNLDLSESNVEELPNELVVYGKCKLSDSSIEKLPIKGVYKKNLVLTNCKKLKKIPNNLVVGEDLFLCWDCGINKINKNWKINGKIFISNNTKIKIDKIPLNIIRTNIINFNYKNTNFTWEEWRKKGADYIYI